MTNFTDSAAAAIPVRLLSSVAVVGRDNEPIYLRGDLCDCSSPSSSAVQQEIQAGGNTTAPSVVTVTEDEAEDSEANNIPSGDEDGEDDTVDGSSPSNNSKEGTNKGFLGRFKGAVGMNANSNADEDDTEGADAQQEQTDPTTDDEDDPFGFFENNNSYQQSNNTTNSNNIPAMSLTQQLVLHASLDRFEEMASRTNQGGAVRWRTPGSNSANAMWMGLLCQVEERWNVYGAYVMC